MPEEMEEYRENDDSPEFPNESATVTPNSENRGREINIEQVDGSQMSVGSRRND